VSIDGSNKWGDVEVLVDSGALFTSIPRSTLEKLGLKPIARQKFRAYISKRLKPVELLMM
jgi:predicted aspartyl protease